MPDLRLDFRSSGGSGYCHEMSPVVTTSKAHSEKKLKMMTSRVTRRSEKTCQTFQRIAQKVAKSKKPKIYTTKLNLKVQNINIKPLLKP
jgi:hypothetical protein